MTARQKAILAYQQDQQKRERDAQDEARKEAARIEENCTETLQAVFRQLEITSVPTASEATFDDLRMRVIERQRYDDYHSRYVFQVEVSCPDCNALLWAQYGYKPQAVTWEQIGQIVCDPPADAFRWHYDPENEERCAKRKWPAPQIRQPMLERSVEERLVELFLELGFQQAE